MSSTQKVYNVGTHIYYAGDDVNEGGYGRITDHTTDYLDGLQLEITLEDGRIISNVTPSEFEERAVAGNTQDPEFHMVDSWEDEVREWEEEFEPYSQENSVLMYSL